VRGVYHALQGKERRTFMSKAHDRSAPQPRQSPIDDPFHIAVERVTLLEKRLITFEGGEKRSPQRAAVAKDQTKARWFAMGWQAMDPRRNSIALLPALRKDQVQSRRPADGCEQVYDRLPMFRPLLVHRRVIAAIPLYRTLGVRSGGGARQQRSNACPPSAQPASRALRQPSERDCGVVFSVTVKPFLQRRAVLSLVLLGALPACPLPRGQASQDLTPLARDGGLGDSVLSPGGDGTPRGIDGAGVACVPAPAIRVLAGSTHKICQVTGEIDRETGQETVNKTWSAYKLSATDLGASFEHGQALVFLFGDSHPSGGVWPNPAAADVLATSADTDPTDCVKLEIATRPDGAYRGMLVPGVDLGEFNVPLHGVSTGDKMYVWFSTNTMKASLLARSDDDGQSFVKVHDLSQQYLINVSAAVVEEQAAAGLPLVLGRQLLLFGSGQYRKSSVYLASTSLAQIEDRAELRVFSGLDSSNCQPTWSAAEADAVPLFDQPCVGELSVHWNALLQAWIALYNCEENPRGIVLRSASQPWGPWSEPELVFQPWQDKGYCHFMHVSWKQQQCDSVHDEGREDVWGGEYGPYPIERFTRQEGDFTLLYFLMSTWNPYNTVLMQTKLQRIAGR
jgi:hypothetical protein